MSSFGPSSGCVHELDMSLRGDLHDIFSCFRYVAYMHHFERVALLGELAVQKAVWSMVCAVAAVEGSFVVA